VREAGREPSWGPSFLAIRDTMYEFWMAAFSGGFGGGCKASAIHTRPRGQLKGDLVTLTASQRGHRRPSLSRIREDSVPGTRPKRLSLQS
jgi:hypothetical protein